MRSIDGQVLTAHSSRLEIQLLRGPFWHQLCAVSPPQTLEPRWLGPIRAKDFGRSALSQKPKSETILECYRRAADARRMADAATSLSERADLLDVEERWLTLARIASCSPIRELGLQCKNEEPSKERAAGRTR
jgi:hypothetical protein